MYEERDDISDTLDPVLTFGVVLRARLSRIGRLAQDLGEDSEIRVVTSKVGLARSIWLVEQGEAP